ncbi:TadE family type IV pilus minor pilin [Actinomadura chibensis]|uniref:TadE family type IV pilus minor pilin n=1 Tax=Actinomadura chibensis TaxID=392828 RepID=UPI0008330FC1|nr:TadE family type IV pilus minor pilin [Actinomadura chibensis]
MVTAEIAVALPSLVLITAIALWGLVLASVQLTCTDAARTGARAAARGESLDAVRELVVKAVPEGATVRVTRDQATVRVDVSASVKPPAAAGLATLTVHAHAVAATEPGPGPDPNESPSPTTPGDPARPTPQHKGGGQAW